MAGDWILIDLWAKESSEDGVYADITWVAYVGDRVPERHNEVFHVVTAARDSALKYLEGSARQGITLMGCQVDRLARDYIARQGYGEYFTHRLGHSIGRDVHADAVNLDSFETEDTRSIIPGHLLQHRAGDLPGRVRHPIRNRRLHVGGGPFGHHSGSAGGRANKGVEHTSTQLLISPRRGSFTVTSGVPVRPSCRVAQARFA